MYDIVWKQFDINDNCLMSLGPAWYILEQSDIGESLYFYKCSKQEWILWSPRVWNMCGALGFHHTVFPHINRNGWVTKDVADLYASLSSFTAVL